jgi:hypothetical protein
LSIALVSATCRGKLRRCVLAAVLLIGVGIALSPATDADDWLPISPDELKMTAEPKAPGASAIYLYRQVDRSDQAKASNERNYVRIKILTEAGREYANIEIPYQDKVNIAGIRARTIHPDGSIVNFDGQVFKTTVQKKGNSKTLVKSFTVPDVQVGSIIEYRFTYDYDDNWIFDSHWVISGELFTKKALFTLKPFERWAVQWNWPAGLPAGATKPVQDPVNSQVHMTAENIPAFQEEEYMPPPNELKFRVTFVYSEDGFESDENKYWKKFAKKQNDKAEGFADRRKAMSEALGSIVSPSDSPEVKLQKIYDRCQQIRNLSYEPPLSAEVIKRDKMRIPENAEEVLKSGYGYGWQITWLFLGLSQAAGLDAHPAMLGRRTDHFFLAKRMDSDELNAKVVVVKLDGKNLFFNPGVAFTPYGRLPWEETNVQGRLLDKDGGSWVETALTPSSDSRVSRVANLQLTDDGSLEGKVTLTLTGFDAQVWRLEAKNEDEASRKRDVEERMKESIPAACEIELKNSPEWTSSKTPLVAEFEVKIPGWLSSAGKHELLPAGFFTATEKHMFEHATRTYPVYFSFPFMKTDDVTVTLPPGWKMDSPLKPINQDAKAVAYTFSVDGKEGSVHLQRSIRSDLYMLSAEQYSVLRAFYQFVRAADDQQVVLTSSATVAGK